MSKLSPELIIQREELLSNFCEAYREEVDRLATCGGAHESELNMEFLKIALLLTAEKYFDPESKSSWNEAYIKLYKNLRCF